MLVTFFDLETTGKLGPECRIIEASFRLCNLNTAQEDEHWESRFNPERHIEAKATAVHHITDDDVKKAPLFKDKIGDIKDLLEGTHLLVAHNLEFFDLPVLKQEFDRVKVELPELQTFDTLIKGNFATDLGKSPTLQEFCFALDVAYDPKLAHSAAYDSAALRDAFFNAVRFGWFTFD